MGSEDLAFADAPVDGVHSCGAYADAYPAGARVGLIGIHEVEDIRAAERGEAHFLHTPNVALTVSFSHRLRFCIC